MKANKNLKQDGFVNQLLRESNHSLSNNWDMMEIEEMVKELYAARSEKNNKQILETIFSCELHDLRTFIRVNYEKTLVTSSDVGSLKLNGMCLSNGEGDGTNSIYIYDRSDLNFLPANKEVAHTYEEISIYLDDCGNTYLKAVADGLIEIYRTGVKQFCIVGKNIRILESKSEKKEELTGLIKRMSTVTTAKIMTITDRSNFSRGLLSVEKLEMYANKMAEYIKGNVE